MLPNYTEYCGTCTVLFLHHDVNQLKQRHGMEQSIRLFTVPQMTSSLYMSQRGGDILSTVFTCHHGENDKILMIFSSNNVIKIWFANKFTAYQMVQAICKNFL